MISNQRVAYTILGIWIVLTAALVRAAVSHNLWHEFFITQIGLIIAGISAFYLLRDKNPPSNPAA